MQNRFTITITDIHGSKHYNLHQIVKKFLFCFVFFILLTIVGGVFYINFLVSQVDSLESRKKSLIKEQFELNLKSKKLQTNILKKSKEFEMIEEKVASIEELVGITPDENLNLDKRLDNISLSSSQQKTLLTLIPNGNVLPFLKVTAPFGWRKHPIKNKREFHPGVDLKSKKGTAIISPADGVVEYAAFHKRGYGKLIILDHSFGFQTRYAHLNKMLVKSGQFVKKGEIIGHVGSTGLSTGPHLHYEVRFIGRMLNPINFLKWTRDNFDEIFKKERRISWQSLINMTISKKL